MPLDVRIISSGSTYYLVNSSGTPTSGGAATGAATTPYSVNAAQWTQTAASRQVLYSGGPPWRVGSTPVLAGYGNVTETIEIGISGSSADNTISLIRLLRQILNTALTGAPAVLYWQPNGASQPAYFEVYAADVQEVGEWQNPAAGFTQVLCRVTWTRSAFGGRLSSGETLINAVSYGTSGVNTNTLGSSGSGDLTTAGGPLNLRILEAGGTGPTTPRIFASTAVRRSTNATGAGAVSTTSTTTFGAFDGAGASTAGNINEVLSNPNLRVRVVLVASGVSSNCEVRFTLRPVSTSATSLSNYDSPWVTIGTLPTGTAFIDLGELDLSSYAGLNTTNADFRLVFTLRSTNGASASLTYVRAEWVLYHSWCQVTYDTPPIGSTWTLNTFAERSGFPALPLAAPAAAAIDAGTSTLRNPGRVRGRPPIYVPGALLLLYWGGGGTTGDVASNITVLASGSTFAPTVTAAHCPLYYTLRGNG